ncbi:hypothetical protein ACIQYS_01570 [Psychrobacillus sp. NPDC096426]|uniref:hypothetical protein n=1 Tax=Psychrobacillus sp. NPDC096426 TaxID=3364491 RepID=UPI003813595D
MEKEQVEIQEVEVSEVEKVEVLSTLEEVGKQIVENGEQLDKAKQLAEEILQERQEFLKSLEKDLFAKEKNLVLKENGLEAFAEVINVDNSEDLTNVVAKLTKIVNDIKVANSYQPKDSNGTQDAYSQAIQNGDVKNAISFKLSNLFGKK